MTNINCYKIIALYILFLIFEPMSINAQDIEFYDYVKGPNFVPRQDYDAFDKNGNSKPRSREVVFVYLDFPDGRVENGTKIPETYSELASVPNLEAVGELGQVAYNTSFPIIGTNYFAKLFKYTWEDRWNMFFSTNKYYWDYRHPDYASHYNPSNLDLSCKAYGSLRDYWREVSSNKFDIIPGTTHSLESEAMYRTGIVNEIKTINGVRYIESIKLAKNKYGTTHSDSYFSSYSGWYANYTQNDLFTDARNAVIDMHQNHGLEFDIESFAGIVIYVFAGGHNAIKGWGDNPHNSAIVRGMYNNIYTNEGVIDGITCITHELAHQLFYWDHTIAGTNCLMNPNQTKDINCPSHPNPVLKLMEGWVTPIHLNYNNSNIQLQPVETSNQVGIITIYGNPSGAPDHLSGECYVVENRRRLNFDEKIMNDNLGYSSFKGGMLIWHYSPYSPFENIESVDPRIKLITPIIYDSLSSIYLSKGNPEFYFAYHNKPGLDIFYELLQNRTYSQEGLKTGIKIDNILQTNHTDVNSNMYFNLNYSISPPPQYDYTILNFSSTEGNKVTYLQGRAFFHQGNTFEYFRIYPGSRIDMAPNSQINLAGVKAIGEINNKIIFASTGYENLIESYFCKFNGMYTQKFSTYDDVDTVIFKNVHFTNLYDNKTKIGIDNNTHPLVPIEIENISTDNLCSNGVDCDLILTRTLIDNLNISGLKTKLLQISSTPQANININNSDILIGATCSFGSNANISFTNCNVKNNGTAILMPVESVWQGVKLDGGGINFSGVTIKGAAKGLNLNGLTNDLKISNCTFDNLNQDLTIDGYIFNNAIDNGLVYGNHFTPSGNNLPIHIWVSNTNIISIENNDMPSTRWTGIALFNCNLPSVKNNAIHGGNAAQEIGIVSYSSGGSYNCNTISNCYEGIALDNSQPVLYQNVVHTNGIGMSLTNNSYPIMSPAYSSSETNNLAGYNHFYNNSGHEIYIFNTENAKNNLLMDKGYNIIEDNINSEYYLIYIENQGWTPSEVIECKNNYWGDIPYPGDKLYPVEYFNYIPFLYTYPSPPANCQYTSINEDNSSMPQQTLILGSVLTSGVNGNYVNAANYSQQLTSLGGSKAFQKVGSRLYYTNKYLDGSGISSLPAYYENLTNANSNDTLLKKYFRGLKIESNVINTELHCALVSLDSIISNPSNPYELMYANIDKLRILSLLDSTSGGDNYGVGNNSIPLPEIFNLLKSDFTNVSGISKLSSKTKIISKNQSANKTVNTSKYDFLLKRIPTDINVLKNKSHEQIKEIIKDKMLYDVLINNYVPNVPPNRSEEYKTKEKSDVENNLPMIYSLSQNYPNPFNPSTTIKYSLPKDNMVIIKIYDVTGREIKTIVNSVKKAGYYSITFGASDLSSGIYFYRIQAGNFVQTKMMVYIK